LGGLKFDSKKLRWDLLPVQPIREVVRILTFGSIKYGANNWMELEEFTDRYYAALHRHLSDWREGNNAGKDHDRDSGCLHLSHVACNIIFLLWHALVKEGLKPKIDIGKRMTEKEFIKLHYSEKIFVLAGLTQLAVGVDEENDDQQWEDIRKDLLARDETELVQIAHSLGILTD